LFFSPASVFGARRPAIFGVSAGAPSPSVFVTRWGLACRARACKQNSVHVRKSLAPRVARGESGGGNAQREREEGARHVRFFLLAWRARRLRLPRRAPLFVDCKTKAISHFVNPAHRSTKTSQHTRVPSPPLTLPPWPAPSSHDDGQACPKKRRKKGNSNTPIKAPSRTPSPRRIPLRARSRTLG
jgi:hypothetical protein